jgi:hypothetical protein
MYNLVTAIAVSKARIQFAAATIQSRWKPQWQRCMEVVVPKSVDPIQIIEQLCGADPSVILVCQREVQSLLLHRYAHDTVRLVDEVHAKSRAFWWPLLPTRWASLLRSHWRVAGMIYVHAWRANQAALLAKVEKPLSAAGFFDQFRYRPAAAAVTLETAGADEDEEERGGTT